MEISKNAKTLLALAGALVLVAAVYSIPPALKSFEPSVCTVNGECQHEIFANQLIAVMPLALLLGMALGAAAYYFFSERKPPSPRQFSREAIYTLLDADEAKIFAKLVENNGRALQSELSYLEGIGKVKAHRLVERMEKKGIIEKEAFGKTNAVRLSKGLQELFFQ
ncbi:Uncharacterised protein [uncultured archaeon]|nr:Uncharacterised protein [uncultured archaeon]